MPELPEVETIRRALAIELPGRRIAKVGGRSIAMRRPLDVGRLSETLTGRRFAEPRRRGKYLLLDVEPPGALLVHLGMSGRLMLISSDTTVVPHTHLRLELDDGRELRFVDPRRFGLAAWIEAGAEVSDSSLAQLGVEPLDTRLESVLPQLLHARRAPLKSLLLDQRLVAGVGNIYAAEALWRAGIDPRRSGSRTSMTRLVTLSLSVQHVLAEAIAEGGTTIRDYATPDGNFGYFAVRLEAYGRQGEPCSRCGDIIRAAVIAGRTTAWCPGCQR